MSSTILGSKMPALFQGISFGADPFGFLAKQHQQFGAVFKIKLPGDPGRVVLCDPEDIKKVFELSPSDTQSHDLPVHFNFGQQFILFQDGATHTEGRRFLSPPLQERRLSKYGDFMLQETSELIDSLEIGAVTPFVPLLDHLALSIISRCIFGAVESEKRARLHFLINRWADKTFSVPLFMSAMLFSGFKVRKFLDKHARQSTTKYGDSQKQSLFIWKELANIKAEIEDIIRMDIDFCRKHPEIDRGDVLANLARAKYEDGSHMDTQTLIDQIFGMSIAGYHTTSITTSWLLRDILTYPEVFKKMSEECQTVFGNDRTDSSKIPQLRYIQAVIQESMRLTPITPVVARTIAKPMVLGGYTLPAGTHIWPCVSEVQRDPTIWEKPECFQPERFIGTKHSIAEYFPWGGGRKRHAGLTGRL